MAVPKHLTDFLTTQPSIKVLHRSDPDFFETKRIFIESQNEPLLVARPQNEGDVAALVVHLASTSTPLAVRVGGHDLSERSIAQDAVQVDLRDITHVRIAEDRATAYIGGGILTQGLLEKLAAEGLMTTVGNAATVGWSAWAMNGGYGIMAGKYGLGCDQIVGARVVLANGTVVQADDRLLRGLRGAGTAFGVVVELQIKVYPLTEITAGFIAGDGGDLQSALTTYFDNNRSMITSTAALPRELYFQPMISSTPGQGPGFVVQFVWAAPPSEEQAHWLDKIASLVPGGKPMVGPIKPAEYTSQLSKMMDSHIQGGDTRTVSIRSLAPSVEAAKVIAKHASQVKPEYGAVFVHGLHGTSVESDKIHPPSVFASREVHLMVEMLGFAYQDAASKVPASAWCRAMHDEIKTLEGVMDETYFPLTQSSILDLEKTYKKEALEFLRALKKELDPTNVFRNAVPLAT